MANGGAGRRWTVDAIMTATVVGFAILAALAMPAATASAQDETSNGPGFSVHDGRLIDAHGNDFVMRGVNHPHSWFQGEMSAIAAIKAKGANTVRVVLSSGDRYTETEPESVAQIVRECARVRLICVLELHDTTGFGDVDDAVSLDEAVDYWLGLKRVLVGHESRVIINIGNEPFGNADTGRWADETIDAIVRLRRAGFSHTLMVDAPNWGQDWSFTMRDSAAEVLANDPHANVIFDVHMYGVFEQASTVRSYIEYFVRADLPLVIGEFGATHTDGDPDERAIMHWAEMYGIGYLGWSWSGNVDPVADLNVVTDFDSKAMTSWGQQLFESPRGIQATAAEASVFSEPRRVPDPLRMQPPVVPTPTAAPAPATRLRRYEAERGVRNGLAVSVAGAGYSGSGYLTGFDSRGDTVTVTVFVDATGTYDLVFGYRAPYGDKRQQLIIGAERTGEIGFVETATFDHTAPRTVRLVEGANRVGIEHAWGWFDLDYVEVWTSPS